MRRLGLGGVGLGRDGVNKKLYENLGTASHDLREGVCLFW